MFSVTFLGQEISVEDALRLSTGSNFGTARFKGMSGAYGAVGGDLSAINLNPAGSIFFNNNYGTISLSNYYIKNNSTYFNKKSSEYDNSLDINQVGLVFVFKDATSKNNWNKFSLAFNYENTNNLNNSIFSKGTNPYNSIGNYFLNFAQGNVNLNTLDNLNFYDLSFNEQQAYLGYNAYLFDPDSLNPDNTSYTSNVPAGGNYYQENYIQSVGYNGKLAFNFSSVYMDKIALGLNLNSHFVNYQKDFLVYEYNSNPLNDGHSTISEIKFLNQLYTYGSGFSFNLGSIVKLTNDFRIGLSYESPTWYRVTDELNQKLSTYSINNPDNIEKPVAYEGTVIYLPYTIKTPSKWTGSLAYIFGNKGLISADVSTRNYANTIFKPENDTPLFILNQQIKNELGNALEFKLGTEYKIKKFSLRAGYRFEESPYKRNSLMGDLHGYSGGLGYNFGNSRLDFAYSHDYRNFNQAFLSSGVYDTAKIKRYNNHITFSYSVNF